MTSEMQWLSEYAQTGDQAAFARLTEQYISLVYSAARRQVRDVHLAEDVAQAVFIVLAQKAKTIPADRPLSSWLLKVTGYCAQNARRTRARRETYERRAAEMAPDNAIDDDWNELAPLLDKGMAKLKPADRDALLLKFFEHKSLREVGEALGVSEEAAQKRVTRAVERLRDYFRRSGATAMLSAAGLAALLATETAKAAPVGLAGSVSAGSLSGAHAAVGASMGTSTNAAALAKGAIVAMAMQKTTALIAAGVVLLLGLGGGAAAYRMMSAPSGPRTVDVSALLPKPAASRSAATFSDGSAVTILGISEVPQPSTANKVADFLGIQSAPPAASTWWAPDGTAIPPVPMTGMGRVSAGDMMGRRQIRLLFSLKGPSSGKAGMTIRVPGTMGNAYSSTMRNGETVFNYVGSLPATADRAAISLGLSKGQWREDAVMSLATTTQPTTRYSGAKMFRSLVDGGGNECVLLIDQNSIPHEDRDGTMQATLKSGKTITPSMWTSDSTKCELRFQCRTDQLAKIAWITRPYEWATLADVALKPTTMPTGRAP